MAKKKRRVFMRKAKEILRLSYEQKFSNRAIGKACKISPTTVGEYLDRASKSNVDFSKLLDMDDETLGKILYPDKVSKESLKADA